MKATMTTLYVSGDTAEECELKMKEEVFKYRDGLAKGSPDVICVIGSVRSPGYEYYEDKDGRVRFRLNRERRAPVFGRPALLKA